MSRLIPMRVVDASSQLPGFEFVQTPTARTFDELGLKCPICGRQPSSEAHDSSHAPSNRLSITDEEAKPFDYYATPITDADQARREAPERANMPNPKRSCQNTTYRWC